MQRNLAIYRQFQSSIRTQNLVKKCKRSFAKHASYEKLANPRVKYTFEFRGWKKWVASAYSLGFFRIAKWTLLGCICYKYWHYVWPVIKYGALFVGGTFFSLYALRFGFYRKFGPAMYEKYKFQLCSTRFDCIFQEYSYLSVPRLSYLIFKTWAKWVVLRPHRKWIASVQEFMLSYEPICYYMGNEYYNGIAIRPLIVESTDGALFSGYFKWFVHKGMPQNIKNQKHQHKNAKTKAEAHAQAQQILNELGDDHNKYYAIMDVKFEGNLNSRVLNIHDIRMHVNPDFGGEILKFEPLKVSIDEEWNATQFYNIFDGDDDGDGDGDGDGPHSQKKQRKNPSLLKKKPSKNKVKEAEYKMKDS